MQKIFLDFHIVWNNINIGIKAQRFKLLTKNVKFYMMES